MKFSLMKDSLNAGLNSHYKASSYKKKKHKKTKAFRKSLQKEPTVNRCLLILNLKPIQIIGQRKALYRQRIPESSGARKETVDIDIFVTSRNSDRKIVQSIRITGRPTTRKKKVEPVPMNIYQSNTYRKDFSWLHFDDEPRVQERQQVKDPQSCLSVFVVYLTIPSSNQRHQPRRDNSIPCIAVWQIKKETEQPQEKETSQNESRLQFFWRQFQQQR